MNTFQKKQFFRFFRKCFSTSDRCTWPEAAFLKNCILISRENRPITQWSRSEKSPILIQLFRWHCMTLYYQILKQLKYLSIYFTIKIKVESWVWYFQKMPFLILIILYLTINHQIYSDILVVSYNSSLIRMGNYSLSKQLFQLQK